MRSDHYITRLLSHRKHCATVSTPDPCHPVQPRRLDPPLKYSDDRQQNTVLSYRYSGAIQTWTHPRRKQLPASLQEPNPLQKHPRRQETEDPGLVLLLQLFPTYPVKLILATKTAKRAALGITPLKV